MVFRPVLRSMGNCLRTATTKSGHQSLLWDSEHQQQQNGVHFNNAGGGVNVISGTSPRKHSGSLHGHMSPPPPPTSLPKRSSFNNLQSHPNPQHNSKGPRRHSALTQMLVITCYTRCSPPTSIRLLTSDYVILSCACHSINPCFMRFPFDGFDFLFLLEC